MNGILHSTAIEFVAMTAIILLLITSLVLFFDCMTLFRINKENGIKKDILSTIVGIALFLLGVSFMSGAIFTFCYISTRSSANFSKLREELNGKTIIEYDMSDYIITYEESENKNVRLQIPNFVVVKTQGASERDYGTKTGIGVELSDSGLILVKGRITITDYSKRGFRTISDSE
jgi:hypothetical protein